SGGGRDHRDDAKPHEFGVPAPQVLRRVRGERAKREAEIFMDIERASDVLLVVGAVLRFVRLALEHSMVDQELAPFVVAVAAEQRVVEVEERQAHAGARSLAAMQRLRTGAARRCGSPAGGKGPSDRGTATRR